MEAPTGPGCDDQVRQAWLGHDDTLQQRRRIGIQHERYVLVQL